MAVKIGPNANFKGFILTRKNNDLSESRHPKRSYVLALLSAAVLPLMLFMLYFTISFMDLWGYAPDIVQAVGLLLCSIMATIVFGWTLYKKVIFSPKLIAVRLAVCLITMTFFALWSNDDFTRLSTLAFKPRALTDYPEPIIIATVTSPLYLGHDSVQKDMSIQQTANRGLNPIYEGSILDVHVKNTPWRPIIKLSDGSKVTFEEQMDGSFKASTKIEQQISWSVNQGTYTIGAWPIILIEDQAPMIKNFTLEADGNDKGYLAFNVDILDDHKIMDVGLEIITDDYSKLADDDQLKLPIREIKSYQNIFYVDFTDTDYSGIEVDLKLNVEDEVGQISTALLHDIKLPEKRFNHLIANKLISLRKELNQKHYDIKSLSRQLLALGLLSESEGLPFVYYMALRSAYWRVTDPAGPEDLQIAKDLL
ncbi:MAG: DUF4175 family protein, partial [Kordiimonadaceae bacterium]|nr:DUF4175 family protein [Kordiimonadaceae bacterium]